VIKFLTEEGVKPIEIKQRMDNVYGDSSSSFTTVKELSKLFRLGRNSIEDDPRQGRPAEVVLANRRLKTKEIAK
jgi:hypothetical protein